MTLTLIASQIFGLIASIVYLLIFLFIVHNVVIRVTPYRSRRSKAVIATGFLLFTGALYTWMGAKGFGTTAYILPSHLFALALVWSDYFRSGKEQSNG